MNTLLAQGIGDILGIDPAILEYGLAGILAIILLFSMRIIFSYVRGDSKQRILEERLIDLAQDASKRSDRMQEAYERNSLTLDNLNTTLLSLAESMGAHAQATSTQYTTLRDEFGPIRTDLKEIRNSLFKAGPTTVVIRDTEGVNVARFSANPTVDEDGSNILVVTVVDV